VTRRRTDAGANHGETNTGHGYRAVLATTNKSGMNSRPAKASAGRRAGGGHIDMGHSDPLIRPAIDRPDQTPIGQQNTIRVVGQYFVLMTFKRVIADLSTANVVVGCFEIVLPRWRMGSMATGSAPSRAALFAADLIF
jgi:hypothetical protein